MKTTIARDVKCGIFDTKFTAVIDKDVIKFTSPFIKWVDNSGNLAFKNTYIRDLATLKTVHAALNGDYPESDRYGDAYDDVDDFIFQTLID